MFKAHRLFYHSTLGSTVIKKKKGRAPPPPVPTCERIWHTQDSQGQTLALAVRQKSLKKLFPLHSEADGSDYPQVDMLNLWYKFVNFRVEKSPG